MAEVSTNNSYLYVLLAANIQALVFHREEIIQYLTSYIIPVNIVKQCNCAEFFGDCCFVQ